MLPLVLFSTSFIHSYTHNYKFNYEFISLVMNQSVGYLLKTKHVQKIKDM